MSRSKLTEDQLLLPLDFYCGSSQEVAGDTDKGHAAQEMCPDVAGLCVDAEYGFEALSERGQWWTMAKVEKVVVLQPLG